MNKTNWKFWAVWGGLLLVGYLIYLQLKKTSSDAGTLANNVYINPLKSLFK